MQASLPRLISGETEASPELSTCLRSPLPQSGRQQHSIVQWGSACRRATVPLSSSRQRGIWLSKQALPSCFVRETDEIGWCPPQGLAPAALWQGGLPDGFRVVRTPQSAGMMRRESCARPLCLVAGLTQMHPTLIINPCMGSTRVDDKIMVGSVEAAAREGSGALPWRWGGQTHGVSAYPSPRTERGRALCPQEGDTSRFY